jgi:putative peptidoglycan lipid II flippase
VVVNIAASFVLSRSFAYVGIALATSVAAWVNACLLMATSIKRKHYSWDARFRARLPRMIVSVLVMAGVLYGLNALLSANYAENAGLKAAAWGLATLLAAGAISYFAAAEVTGAFKLRDLKSALRR